MANGEAHIVLHCLVFPAMEVGSDQAGGDILLYELIHQKVDCREWCCSHFACTLFNEILLPS